MTYSTLLSLLSMVLAVLFVGTRALDNGVAVTPPMGWCSWQRYRCVTACADPISANCFNEGLIKKTADAMVDEGYLAAGYEYLVSGQSNLLHHPRVYLVQFVLTVFRHECVF